MDVKEQKKKIFVLKGSVLSMIQNGELDSWFDKSAYCVYSFDCIHYWHTSLESQEPETAEVTQKCVIHRQQDVKTLRGQIKRLFSALAPV